ncbi:MAG: M4 family metallopeptidase [Candidatus Helarchaeota archaeon]
MIEKYFCHDDFCRIIPPYMIDKLLESKDSKIRKMALLSFKIDNFIRSVRFIHKKERDLLMEELKIKPVKIVKKKIRHIYDSQNSQHLPGILVRKEGDKLSNDKEVDEAYEYLGDTYDFYNTIFKRNSIDNKGMRLDASVHYGDHYNNAFWNGWQMVFGDGDGKIFNRFTLDLDVVGHELTHGVTQHECALIYRFQSGALNESFSDIFGSMIKQFKLNQTVDQADWLIGANLLIGEKYAIRSLKSPGTAYVNHPQLGTDPQPSTMDKYKDLEIYQDNGGVHVNCGIPNHAFYVAAMELGGYAWEKVGLIWYKLLQKLDSNANFERAAKLSIEIAEEMGEQEREAVIKGWKEVMVI